MEAAKLSEILPYFVALISFGSGFAINYLKVGFLAEKVANLTTIIEKMAEKLDKRDDKYNLLDTRITTLETEFKITKNK
jgi:prefoldin subunit 5